MYAANLERDGARSGNAILSRWPIVAHEVRTLPRDGATARSTTKAKSGSCVFAEVDGPRGPIQMFCAHLSWRDDHSAIRQEQVAEICRFVREHRPRPFPAVLCGDLNAEPRSDEIRMLTGRAAAPVPGVDVPRRVGGGRQRRSPATRGRTTTRSRPRASTSTAASTT